MKESDALSLAAESLRMHRMRTLLSLGGIAIGATAVLLLTALGDAARRYVVDQFAGIGTNLVFVLPGKVETSGVPITTGGSTRDVTLEDAEALAARVSAAERVAPMALGTATFAYGQRDRQVYVGGTTDAYLDVVNLDVAVGQWLPPGDPRRGERVVVIGQKLRREVFGDENPLGKPVRIAQARFRVIGVLAPKGQSLGIDFDDVAFVPVGAALRLFNQPGLHRVALRARDAGSVAAVLHDARTVLRERHDGDEDFTLLTQDAMLATFESIIHALTIGLAGIAAISLAVAGIGIMNVMLVTVTERTGEIGLVKALGARRAQILRLFLLEAVMLATLGALVGTVASSVLSAVAERLLPGLTLRPSPAWIAVVFALCVATGVGFGLLPARRAAAMPAIESLRKARA